MSPTHEPLKPLFFTDEVGKDREHKKQLIIDMITSRTNCSSDFDEIKSIDRALKRGNELCVTTISGGVTNFSYRVTVVGEDAPETALYVKLFFPYALWGTDKKVHYDVNRGANEFKLMRHLKKILGDDAPVATPYICTHVEELIIFVTSWAPADEQWANQFIDGVVDRRIIPKLANCLATINLTPFEGEFNPEFNEEVRPTMLGMLDLTRQTVFEHLASKNAPADDCIAYLRQIGQEKFFFMMDNLWAKYSARDCINHSDSHVFNVLVESKPPSKSDQQFGDDGSMILCDWEMAMAGPHGRDVGIFQAWPIACSFFHTAQGHKTAAYIIIERIFELWDEYAKSMIERGDKDEAFLMETYRTSLGFTAKYLFIANYLLGMQFEFLPTDGLSEEIIAKAKAAIGEVGIKVMEYGFGEKELGLSLEELRARYRSLVTEKIESLAAEASKYGAQPTHTSILRETEQRVSDAGMIENVVRRASNAGKPAIYDKQPLREMIDEER
uniref:Aminoglycoside phosphotransferase domain-containing protein n=1 Tax=Odontella aurita TaxID=265563 RepID=A0A7S4JQ96_9STRA|mmetsp:Transcript_51241/g.153944  ORF Transcript_51241/g.153944 Transcript_51241/m.153944 type:complete len:499 (+) Transcript_51241:486-1982(+)